MSAAHDPALRFWLDYAEAEGAAWEAGPDKAQVLLPPHLQAALRLPEEVAVTADPEVAAEDGALLLLPGHPVLERAAADVLARADAGYAFLPWPRSRPPDAAALLHRARDRTAVLHGRIDPAGDVLPVRLPLLRAVALVTYSGDQQFQELEEVWADARSGLLLPAPARRALAALPVEAEPEGPPAPALAPDWDRALAGVWTAVGEAAALRSAAFGRQAEAALRAETARAAAYYDDILASLRRRQEAAEPERRALLEAQATATAAERERRLAEIRDKARYRYEARAVRLHLLLAPALFVPVTVRRGERAHPWSLVWMLGAAEFAPEPCPHCGACAELVAGRERLGCRACLPAPRPDRP